MTTRVFISHSTADQALAEALIDYLLAGIVLADDEVRCTSVPGHRLPVGEDFAETLRRDLDESSVVVGLITQNSIASGWVLFELGATWGSGKHLKPLIADDVELTRLPGPITGRHVGRLSSADDLRQLTHELMQILRVPQRPVGKSSAPLQRLLLAHEAYLGGTESRKAGAPAGVESETMIGSMTFRELTKILGHDCVSVPAGLLRDAKADKKMSLFQVLTANGPILAGGVLSTAEEPSLEHFLYHSVALRLLPYGLVTFDPQMKGTASRRLMLSSEGNQLLVEFRRLYAWVAEQSAKK